MRSFVMPRLDVRVLIRALPMAMAIALVVSASPSFARDEDAPPKAQRKPVTRIVHGQKLTDDYAWMRTAKPEAVLSSPERLEPAIRQHLEQEQRYAKRLLSPDGRWAPVREQLVALFAEANTAGDGTFAAEAEYLLATATRAG